jgi:hypothetical protein
MTARNEALATYAQLDKADPAFATYYPGWLNTMADDVILEGSMINGVVQGPEDVRNVIGTIRAGYEREAHTFVTEAGGRLIEEYVAVIRGEPIGCILLVTSDAAGRTTHVAAGYRPLSSLNLLASILREKFAGLPLADQFGPSK